ncbi:MAG: hypothetical protein IKY70_08060 [Bacteroidales bacterium]|nr:hypothetical protein [Bacteroidales bacterium]
MKNIIFNIIIAAFLLYSCNTSEKYPGIDFKFIGTISNGDTVIYDVPCTNIRSIHLVDSLIVLHCDNTLDEKLLQVYHSYNGKKITSFAQYGRGPGEVDFVEVSYQRDLRVFQFITDHGQNITFNIDSVMNGNLRGHSINLKSKLRGDQYSFIDTLLFSSAAKYMNDFYRFAIMSPTGDTIMCYRDGSQKRTPVILKPDYSKCFTYSNGNFETEVFSLSKNSIKLFARTSYINPNKPISEEHIKLKEYPGIVNFPFPSDKYIYTPWSVSLNPHKSIQADKILVFDWNGKAKGYVTIEKLNKLEGIMNINEENKQLFLVVKNANGQLNIVRYDMSHLPL